MGYAELYSRVLDSMYFVTIDQKFYTIFHIMFEWIAFGERVNINFC